MSNVYHLTNDLSALQAMLESSEDAIEQDAIATTIAGLATDLKDVVEHSVKLIKNIEADANSLKAEIERLSARKKRCEARVAAVRAAIKTCIEAAGETKVATPLFTVSVAQGRESVSINDEQAVPDEYTDVETTIVMDKKAIAKQLKAGVEVPGCALVRGDSTLKIR